MFPVSFLSPPDSPPYQQAVLLGQFCSALAELNRLRE